MKTRDRILEVSRTLFNERGEGNVSSAQIAEAVGIAEGNLWYHFRTRRDLIRALFNQLTERREPPPPSPRSFETPGEQMVAFLDVARRHLIAFWDYRFLFRDKFPWIMEADEDIERAREEFDASQSMILWLFEELQHCGLISLEDEDRRVLAINSWIVLRYWLDFAAVRHGNFTYHQTDIQAGLEQLVAMCRPFLSAVARAEAARILAMPDFPSLAGPAPLAKPPARPRRTKAAAAE